LRLPRQCGATQGHERWGLLLAEGVLAFVFATAIWALLTGEG
jgi:hypothetical protein